MFTKGRSYFKGIKGISNTLKSVFKEKFKGNDTVIVKGLEDNKVKVLKLADEVKEELDDIVLPVTEKEKDATVRSKLSKECGTLREKKIFLSSTGLNVALSDDICKKTDWENYQFDRTVKNLQEKIQKSTSSNQPGDTIGSGSFTTGNRPIRGDPGEVLLGFVPYEWFTFFIHKTGYTGFGTFVFTLTTCLVSKEIYVLEHNFYNGLSMAILAWASVKYVGPHVSAYLDKELNEYENSWNNGRKDLEEVLNQQIEDELLVQFQIDGQLMLIEAKRENVALQLEAEFRKRQIFVYKEVLKRLNYHLAAEGVKRRYQHRNLVDYVQKEVIKALTPDMQKKMIDYSISNLLQELEKK